jgi:hypothetical protein
MLEKPTFFKVEPSPAAPPAGELWGLGGEYLTRSLGGSSRLRLDSVGHFAICDPDRFLAEASLDTDGDGVFEFEFGWRICPDGSAFEVREHGVGPDPWRTVARWLTPWPSEEGPPRCMK